MQLNIANVKTSNFNRNLLSSFVLENKEIYTQHNSNTSEEHKEKAERDRKRVGRGIKKVKYWSKSNLFLIE